MAPACAPIILPPRSKKDPRRCLGRSRGGLGTKIHALTNQDGLPIRYELTPGQAHDAPPCKTLLDNLQPGQHVLADKAYDAEWIRDMIWEQGAIDVIPPKANRKLPTEDGGNETGRSGAGTSRNNAAGTSQYGLKPQLVFSSSSALATDCSGSGA